MSSHDKQMGADYFTTHAGVALDDVRDPEEGFDIDELARLASAAAEYAARLSGLIAAYHGGES